MEKNKVGVITFKVCDKTQDMMSEELDWCKRPNTPPYAKWQAKDGDTVITLYESGKVVFQGKDADLASDFWITTEKLNSGKVDVKNSANKEKKEKLDYINPKIYYASTIGSDEVGTGDYFGPIVVTATFVAKENIPFLEELGVKDSKKMTDDKILEVVPKIIKTIPYESIILSNKEYNEKYNSDINMNKIKAILHNKALMTIKNKEQNYDYIVVDQFAEPYVYFNYLKTSSNVVRNITFMTKAEDKCLSVACASIISRYIFLKEFDKLSKNLGMNLLKGASDKVDEQGLTIVKKYGIDKLSEIAKLNFKNTEKIKAKL
jgi:ribonuclease HIII